MLSWHEWRMRSMGRAWLGCLALAWGSMVGDEWGCGLARGAEGAEKLDPKGVAFFESKIRPVLTTHCYKCHSADAKEVKGGLWLDTRLGMRRGGELGPAVVPGDLKASLLIQALRHSDDLKMPPSGKLGSSVIADFEAWIRMGAPDPREGGKLVETPKIDLEKGKQHWAFRAVVKPSIPSVARTDWPRGDIDRLALAKLEASRLSPSPDAEPQVLARRLTYDLTGLPPSPEEMASFIEECNRPTMGWLKATERLVDRLLASPAYGERWGRHWLDIARYAESNGNVDNNLFPYAWRYRNYVIDALNQDKPYNTFITEQLAGDLLPYKTSAERNEQLVATGFLALTSKPRAQNNPDFKMDLVADQIEVATTSLMGLTVACARCHDHKFDPIPQNDYYALAGIFTSSEMMYGVMTRNDKVDKKYSEPKFLELETVRDSVRGSGKTSADPNAPNEVRRRLQQQLSDAQELLAKLPKPDKGEKAGDGKKPKLANPANVKLIAQRRELRALMDATEAKLLAMAPKPGGDAKAESQEESLAMGIREGRPGDTKLCIRGESEHLGDVTPRGFVQVITWRGAPRVNPKGSGRRELAEWIASKENPLTARVLVNRVWLHLFGSGLVVTPDNFGLSGEPPVNPALLDYLAARFVERGWSLKQLIREIVLSRTYQQGGRYSEAADRMDPENLLLWRHSARRLDAEEIRDSLLVAAGTLVREPLRGTLIAQYGTQEVKNEMIRAIAKVEGNYRSIYLPAVRDATPETLEAFDAADTSLIVGKRETTTIPSQALFLMNNGEVRRYAEMFAARLEREGGNWDSNCIEKGFAVAFGRAPAAGELKASLAYLDAAAGDRKPANEKERRQALTNFCQALFMSAEFRYVE